MFPFRVAREREERERLRREAGLVEDSSKLSGDADATLGYCCARPGNDTDCVCDEAQFRVKGECTTRVKALPRGATYVSCCLQFHFGVSCQHAGFACLSMEPALAMRLRLAGWKAAELHVCSSVGSLATVTRMAFRCL